MFNFTTSEADSTDIALRNLLLEASNKKLNEKEAPFDYFDGSCIRDFNNVWHQDYGKTQWHNLLNETW